MGERAEKSPNHTAAGKFLPGHKAHRTVRRKRLPASMIKEAVGTEAVVSLLQAGMAEAEQDINSPWAHFFAQKLIAPAKPEARCVELPLDDCLDDPVEMNKRVLRALGEGEISPDAAASITQSIGTLATAIDTANLAEEIAELKALLGGTKQ